MPTNTNTRRMHIDTDGHTTLVRVPEKENNPETFVFLRSSLGGSFFPAQGLADFLATNYPAIQGTPYPLEERRVERGDEVKDSDNPTSGYTRIALDGPDSLDYVPYVLTYNDGSTEYVYAHRAHLTHADGAPIAAAAATRGSAA